MQKVCIINCASIGDTLLTTPLYRAIKKYYPQCKIVSVLSYAGYEMLEGNPYIDVMKRYKKGDFFGSIVKAMWQADAAFILDGHYRSALMAFLALVRKRVGPGRDFINVHTSGQELDLFEAQRYMNVLKCVGIEDDDLTLMRPLPTAEEKKSVARMIEDLRRQAKKIVTISPYSLSALKDWEPEKYNQVIDKLHANDCEAIIIGGKNDMSKSEKDFSNAVNLVGKINLRESSEVIARADLHLCGCTSMLHVASAVGTPSVAIYGPTSPIQWAPRQNCTVITHNLPCSPCYKKDVYVCDNNKCIKGIDVDEVWEVVAGKLELFAK